MRFHGGQRVLLIGIDSADVDYLEDEPLPRLENLFAGTVVRRLDALSASMSGGVWPTFYTGSPPGVHGQYFPMQWDPAAMRLRHVSPVWLDCEPFWRPLAREGLAVTTLDVQNTFPARTTDGVEVLNWGVEAFGGFHCNRPEIRREIVRRFGHDAMRFDAPVDKSPVRLATMRRRLLASARRRGELARWLLRETSWQLFAAVFTECHRAGHYFWPCDDGDAGQAASRTLREIHRAVDDEVGQLLDAVDLRETTVIVFSLLGMAPNRSQMHFVPPVLARITAALNGNGALPPARGSVTDMLRRHLPPALQERIALAVPERVRDWVVGHAYVGGIDWRHTPAFALPTGGEGYVRLSLGAREASGYLPPNGELHRRYLALVDDEFRSLRVAATGEPLVEDILRPGEDFAGPRSQYLPDLSIAWRPAAPATEVRSERLGVLRGRLATGRPGNHRPAAFAAVAGPAAASRRAETLRTSIDLAHFVRDLLVGRT